MDASPPDFLELPHIPFEPLYTFPPGFDTQQSYPLAVENSAVSLPLTSFLDPHSGITNLTVELFAVDADPATALGLASGALLPTGWPLAADLSDESSVASLLNTSALLAEPSRVAMGSEGAQPRSVSVPGVTLTNATYVFARVTAINGMGMVTVITSRAVPVSTETLSAGAVVDSYEGSSPDDDLDYRPTNRAYSTRWSGFTDPRSPIWYAVALGSAPGSDDIRSWQDVGAVTALDVLQDFEVPLGTLVYATVRARKRHWCRGQRLQ